MIPSKLAALLLATATVGAGPMLFIPSTAQAQAEVEVSFDFFNDSLSPYGEWVEVGDYGLCWRPNDVGDDWAPYTDGYWSYTDAGWTWVSYEDFGGIVYHYGRWVNVEDEGWCWVPDYEWGPAWVSWRNSDEHIGWAPLPPEARWEPSVGFSVWVDNSYDIGPSYYNFCAVEDFGAPVIREVILPRPRNVVIIGNTVNITNITVNNFIGVPFCGGPRFDVISHRVRRPIPALKLVRETNITNIYNNTVINKTVIKNDNRRVRAIHSVQQGNQLIVAAPRIKRVANPLTALPQIKPKRAIPAAKVRKGWNLVQDPEQRTRLKQKFAQETKGLRPDTAPARAIQTAELKPVPEKADPTAPSPAITGRRGNRNGKNDPNERPERPERTERAAQVGQPMNPGVVPGTPAAEANDDKPDKPGRGKNGKERGEKAGIAAGERSPLKPFTGGNAPDAPGRNKDRQKKPDGVAEVDRPAAVPTAPVEPAGGPNQEKVRKEREQVNRAAEIQEEFRKRQREQAQPGRMENKPGKADKAERTERRQEAQAAAAEIRREQQARAAQKEAAREQAANAQAERQREASRREQQQMQAAGEARRQQQQEALERRQQRMQSEAFQRRANQAQDGAMEQRRQQAQAQAAAAAQARREQQMQSMQRQQQAVRQQQAEAQQQRAQALRQQQMQAQRQFQRQQMQAQPQMQRPQMQSPQQRRGGGGNNGEGRGRDGRREKKD